MQKLLSMYQLWLDDLYPRAKFADGLTIIEKLGHSKRIQMMRKEWISEGKPKPTDDQDDDQDDFAILGNESADISTPRVAADPGAEEDMFDSLIRDAELEHRDREGLHRRLPDHGTSASATVEPELPQEDELDALLAESSRNDASNNDSMFGDGQKRQVSQPDDMFADELEAMQGMEGMW